MESAGTVLDHLVPSSGILKDVIRHKIRVFRQSGRSSRRTGHLWGGLESEVTGSPTIRNDTVSEIENRETWSKQSRVKLANKKI